MLKDIIETIHSASRDEEIKVRNAVEEGFMRLNIAVQVLLWLLSLQGIALTILGIVVTMK